MMFSPSEVSKHCIGSNSSALLYLFQELSLGTVWEKHITGFDQVAEQVALRELATLYRCRSELQFDTPTSAA